MKYVISDDKSKVIFGSGRYFDLRGEFHLVVSLHKNAVEISGYRALF